MPLDILSVANSDFETGIKDRITLLSRARATPTQTSRSASRTT